MRMMKIIVAILLIGLGGVLFVFAEYDDSPGGQLIGVAVAILGAWRLWKIWRK